MVSQHFVHILLPVTDICSSWITLWRNDHRNDFMINLQELCGWAGIQTIPLDLQSEGYRLSYRAQLTRHFSQPKYIDIFLISPRKRRLWVLIRSPSNEYQDICFHGKLTLKRQEKLHLKMSSVYVVCWIFLQTSQSYFCIPANSVDPDQTAPKGAVWSGSTLFAEMTFKITSRRQSRRQLLWLEL